MNPTQVMEISKDLMTTAFMISLPALLVSLLVGLIVSVLQAITSIQEQTLSFVPRLLAVGFVLLFFLNWILQTSVNFTIRMITQAAEVVR